MRFDPYSNPAHFAVGGKWYPNATNFPLAHLLKFQEADGASTLADSVGNLVVGSSSALSVERQHEEYATEGTPGSYLKLNAAVNRIVSGTITPAPAGKKTIIILCSGYEGSAIAPGVKLGHIRGTAAATGLVSSAGHIIGATSIVISAGTGSVKEGDKFTLATDATEYTATSNDANLASGTNTIGIDPPLAADHANTTHALTFTSPKGIQLAYGTTPTPSYNDGTGVVNGTTLGTNVSATSVALMAVSPGDAASPGGITTVTYDGTTLAAPVTVSLAGKTDIDVFETGAYSSFSLPSASYPSLLAVLHVDAIPSLTFLKAAAAWMHWAMLTEHVGQEVDGSTFWKVVYPGFAGL